MISRRRPALVTWLSLGFLALGAIYLLRLVGGLMAPDLPLTVPHWYPPLTGGVWGLAWCAVALATFAGRRWARQAILVGGGAFLLWYWLDRLAFVRSDYGLRTMPFSAGLTLLGMVLTFAILRQSAVQHYFGETNHE